MSNTIGPQVHSPDGFAGARLDAGCRPLRYRVAILAPSVVEVIQFTGGLIYDRVVMGWEVTVLVADAPHGSALQILGTRALDLESALANHDGSTWPQALVLAGELFGCDERVRRGLLHALDEDLAEVTLWGDSWPSELGHRVGSVQHHLSSAARAFKAQALAAAGATPRGPVFAETFRSGGLLTLASCLVPKPSNPRGRPMAARCE